jgi:hypothetical protein
MGSSSYGEILALPFALVTPTSIEIVRGMDACAMASDRG